MLSTSSYTVQYDVGGKKRRLQTEPRPPNVAEGRKSISISLLRRNHQSDYTQQESTQQGMRARVRSVANLYDASSWLPPSFIKHSIPRSQAPRERARGEPDLSSAGYILVQYVWIKRRKSDRTRGKRRRGVELAQEFTPLAIHARRDTKDARVTVD